MSNPYEQLQNPDASPSGLYPAVNSQPQSDQQNPQQSNVNYQAQPQPQQYVSAPAYNYGAAMGAPAPSPQHQQPAPYPQAQPVYYAQPVQNVPYGQPYSPPAGPPVHVGHVVPEFAAVPVVPAYDPSRGYGAWKDGLFECNNVPICCLAFFLPFYRWAKTMDRAQLMGFWRAFVVFFVLSGAAAIFYTLDLDYGNRHRKDRDDDDDDDDRRRRNRDDWYWNQPHLGWALALANVLTIILLVVVVKYRMRIRSRYNIPGSNFNDCVTVLCCSWCALAQEARHVDYAGNYTESC